MKKITFKFIFVALLLLVSNVNSFAQLFLNASPTQGCAPLTVTYNLTGNYAGEYRYEWNFQDGSPIFRDTVPFSTTITHQFFNAGYYNAVINVFDANNNPISPSNCNNCNVQVNGFSINAADSACVNDIISFNVNGQGMPNSAIWNFGDGSPISNDFNPSHAYASIGTKTITLVTNGGQCGNQTLTKNIYVATGVYPHPNAWTNSNVSCTAVPINFSTNAYSTYSWNFGDGGTSNVQNPQHLYTTNGTKNVSLTVTNGCGKSGTTNMTVVISNTPAFPNYPDFKLQNPSLSCPNSNLGFNAPGGYNNYVWNFGDGTPLVTTTNNFTNHTYDNTLTTYTASVKITSPCGNDTTLTSTVLISSTAPWPNNNFNLNVNSPSCPNSYVGLNAPAGYSNYQWNFGDGSPVVTTNNNQNNHFYNSSLSTYNVSVKITSSCGNDTTLYSTLAITNSAPFPNQSWFKLETGLNTACPSDNVGFNAPGGYSNYQWNFGDGFVANTTDNFNTHIFANIGTFTVSVKIINGCGNDTILYKAIQIINSAPFPNYPDFRLNVNSPACPNSNVGFEAPGGYTNYLWNFGDGTALVTSNDRHYNHTYGTSLQVYTVSVKITNGCGQDTTLYTILEIKNNVGFSTDSWFKVEAGPNPSCPNDQVNFNAPWGYSNYFWKFGDGDSISSSQGNAHHAYSAAATYTYYVKITNACGKDTILYGTIVVGITGSFYSGLSINTDPSTSSCPNDLIHFKLNQNGFQSYAWDFGDGTTLTTAGEDIQHAFTTVGIKTVSCKVKNGCGDSTTIFATVQVLNNSPVSEYLEVKGIQNPSCPGDKVFFVIDHGQGTTEYIWNYGDGSPADTTIGSGTHHIYTTPGAKTVTVLAKNACGMTKTITMVQNVSTTISPSLIGDDGKKTFGFPGGDGNNTTAGCAGDAIVFYFMGDAANNVWDFGDGNTGTATEHVLIDGGDGVFPVTIIKHVFGVNGSYNVSLTLTNNCGNSVTDSISLNIGGNQVVNGELVTSPPPYTTCAPIDFLAFGGANYAWNFGDGATLSSSSPTASHTFAADSVYVVTVVITNGCGNSATYSKSVNVNGAGGPAVTLTSSTSPTCGGGNNGSATISVANGQEPYTYLWNDPNAQDSSTVTNLAAGIYYATVTDNIGCASTFAVSITSPAPIVLSATSTQSACGSATGTATASVTSGGTSPFTYLWTGGSTAATATGLSYGLYTVTVTDFNGCTSTANVSVSEAGTATITLNTVSDAGCNGGSDGAVNITIAGGTAPFTYAWSNGAITQNLSNIPAGTYSLIVTDAGSCKATFNATVGQADSMSVSVTPVVSPTCGNFDGSTTATVTGGTTPYTYLWDSNAGNQATQVATGLPAGTYSVTVTDGNGCTQTGEISLSNSNAPIITAVVSDVTCNNLGNGSINITITGGTSPYLKTWNVAPPQTNNEDLTALIPGNYFIFVDDAQGCTSVRSYTITQPALLVATATSTGATCGSNNGTSTVTTTGGNTIATYSWTSGDATQTATGLALGSNSVIVTDVKGCVASATTTVALEVITPSICMVTVDEESVNNLIYWDKTSYTAVDSFIVYREVSTALYKRIGAVAYDSLSVFTDTTRNVGPANGDPNTGTYRYKLQLLDSCGNYSALSPYHNTIYILDIGSGQFSWNVPYTIEGEPNPVTNYNLICDTAGLNTWFVVGTVAGTQTLAVDANFADHTNNPVWRVKTDWGISCDPTRAPVSTTRSNKKAGIMIGIQSIETLNTAVTIYPNPAKDNVTIELSSLTQNAQLKIVNVLGQTVFNEIIIASQGKKVKQINTSSFAKGVYTVVIETNTEKVLKKLVVN
ncbi:MAG: PKD domain-containing protein [Bacteroidia bacterium]|nr:PKD domain-containing protein [Bacteroidia bacterium]